MVERRARIPAEEVADSKDWNLPFWTEPASVIKAREKAEAETLVEEEEIDIEPLTAEQLEQIRQQAYNEGLQQGLVEGRQEGVKLGMEDGRAEGLKLGQDEGRKLGFEAGSEEGKNQAQQEGQQQTEHTVSQLQAAMAILDEQFGAQKAAMETLLPELVLMLAEAVVGEELDQGSAHIVALVNTALEALPLSHDQLSIEVHTLDLPHLEAAFEGGKFAQCLTASDALEVGGCRLLSEYSTVDFSRSERWQSVVSRYHSQLQLGLLHAEDTAEVEAEAESESESESESEASAEASAEVEASTEASPNQPSAAAGDTPADPAHE